MSNQTEISCFSTHLGFDEYTGHQHLYDGNYEETCRGTREEVVAYLQSLLSLIPAGEESLQWQGANGTWYSGDEARAVIKAEILDPRSDVEEEVDFKDAVNWEYVHAHHPAESGEVSAGPWFDTIMAHARRNGFTAQISPEAALEIINSNLY